MTYNKNIPAVGNNVQQDIDNIRENFRVLEEEQFGNADRLRNLAPGNAAGNVAVSNGTLCANLNSALLDGNNSSFYRNATNINAGTLNIDRLPTVGAAKGGTGLTSYTAGDLLFASAATTISKLAKGTAGQFLKQGANAPEWGDIVQRHLLALTFSEPGENEETIRFELPRNFTIKSVRIISKTAPTQQATIEIFRNSTSYKTINVTTGDTLFDIDPDESLNSGDIMHARFSGEPYGMTMVSVMLELEDRY